MNAGGRPAEPSSAGLEFADQRAVTDDAGVAFEDPAAMPVDQFARRLVLGIGLDLHHQQVGRHVGAQRTDLGSHFGANVAKQFEN